MSYLFPAGSGAADSAQDAHEGASADQTEGAAHLANPDRPHGADAHVTTTSDEPAPAAPKTPACATGTAAVNPADTRAAGDADTPVFQEPKTWRVHHLAQSKAAGRKLTMLTAYDALTAALLDKAGVDTLLVGDSYGNVMLGLGSTLPVSLEDMVRATAAVASVAKRPLVIADLPFGSYEASPARAFESAAQLMKAGANMVKLEGAGPRLEAVWLLTSSGIPVCGHLGFTPQSENSLGGPRMQGRGSGRERLIADALTLQDAGASLLVLEMVPADVAQEVTERLDIPTIGIGAGPGTSGQVLVWSDMVGMTEWTPRFVRRFAELGQELTAAAAQYCAAVQDGSFPAEENYHAH